MGCGIRISSGLDWVFLRVDRAVILEDDCVPDLSFFAFCEELLAKYEMDDRIATISGSNFYEKDVRNGDSYFFSRRMIPWGWATWRRAWSQYDGDLRIWPKIRDEKWLYDIMDAAAADVWTQLLQRTYRGQIDEWDYKFFLNLLAQNALSILPKVNLVTNTGFDQSATHTKNPNAFCAAYPARQMRFPMQHPDFMIPMRQVEEKLFRLT